MNALTAARDQLAAALAATGAAVYPVVPDTLDPPCVVLQPGEDWLTPSDTFDTSEYDVTFEVWLVIDYRSPEQATTDLDVALTAALDALAAAGWTVDKVARPGPMHTADWLAHGQQLTVSNLTTL